MSYRKTIQKRSLKKELDFFEELFSMYYPRLRKYGFSFLHDMDEAEDMEMQK